MWEAGRGCFYRYSLSQEIVLAIQQGSVPNSKLTEKAVDHQYKSPSLSYNKPRQAAHGMKAKNQ
jgi:hypothetical protein